MDADDYPFLMPQISHDHSKKMKISFSLMHMVIQKGVYIPLTVTVTLFALTLTMVLHVVSLRITLICPFASNRKCESHRNSIRIVSSWNSRFISVSLCQTTGGDEAL